MLFARRHFLSLIPALVLTILLSAVALGAPKPGTHPRLFFSPEDLPGLGSRLKTAQGAAILERLDSVLEASSKTTLLGNTAGGLAVRYALKGDAQAAEKALTLSEEAMRDALADPASLRPKQLADLLPCASAAMGVSIAYDLCYNVWPAARRASLSRSLNTLASRLIAACEKTRNQQPTHDLAIVSAAAGLAGLSISGDPGVAAEALSIAKLARLHTKRFLDDLGDKGWPHEGFGDLRSAIGNGLGGFALTWRRLQGEDLVTSTSALWWPSLYCTLLLPPDSEPKNSPPDLVYFGHIIPNAPGIPGDRWESTPQTGGDVAAILAFSDSASRAALQWTFDHCLGVNGDHSFNITKPTDALFVLLGLPAIEASLDPTMVLGRAWSDTKAGVFLYRNQWADGRDSLAGINANLRPMPGHSFADTGSFRLHALGGHWAVQREQDAADLNLPARERENVVVIPGTHGWHSGKIIQTSEQPDGSGAVSINMDAPYTVASMGPSPALLEPTQDLGIRAQRAWLIDYSGISGAPVLMVVVDQIKNGPTRRWLMHTEERDVKLHPDGFELRAPNGSTLRATIISPVKPKIRVDRGEWTDTVAIDGDGDFFVIMTVQAQGVEAPAAKRVRDEGLATNVKLGDCIIRYDGHGIAIQ